VLVRCLGLVYKGKGNVQDEKMEEKREFSFVVECGLLRMKRLEICKKLAVGRMVLLKFSTRRACWGRTLR
jgi:hypothetical protein